MFLNYLPTKVAKSLMNTGKKAGNEVAFFLLGILLRLLVPFSFWRFVERMWRC